MSRIILSAEFRFGEKAEFLQSKISQKALEEKTLFSSCLQEGLFYLKVFTTLSWQKK